MTLKQKIELLPTEDSGKLAVSNLMHLSPAIVANVQGSGTLSDLTETVLSESLTHLLSDFDAEIGKNRTLQRFIELAPFTRFNSTAGYTMVASGTLVAEELVLAQPLPYSSLRIRRVFVDVDAGMTDAVIGVLNVLTGATTEVIADLVPGINKIELSPNIINSQENPSNPPNPPNPSNPSNPSKPPVPGINKIELSPNPLQVGVSIATDLLPAHIKVGVVADGTAGFRPITSAQLTGHVRRASLAPYAWCQWELVVDMNKIADAYADELTEAYHHGCGLNVLSRHITSKEANRQTLVGREQMMLDRAELKEQYERILCNACKKIYEAISKQPAVRHAPEFDRGISVGSMV